MKFPAAAALLATLAAALSTAGIAVNASENENRSPRATELTQTQRAFFETHIRPVLVKQCYECHSNEVGSPAAEYALDTGIGMRRGGVSGEAAVVPGDPQGSRLLRALKYGGDLQMPPEKKLPDDVVAKFEQWIGMGAPDPRDADPEEMRRRAQKKSAAKLWSFQPPQRPRVPDVHQRDWPASDIDHFVLSNLEQHDLRPVSDADPRKLIRRVHFDLIGLPPSPAAVDRFAANPSVEAFTSIVDSLLNSPRFGERWGRHWLDLARYAESSGMEFNFTYPHAWPYRDYVIDSFNADKAYDQFIIEQLAGDQLTAASDRQRDAQRIATGFLAVGPKRHNARTTEFRAEMVDDQVRATTEAFLGLTVGCARCHDHKFDPVPTEDYYALAGIFFSTDTLYGTTKIKYSRHPTDLIAFGPDAQRRHEAYVAHQRELEEARAELDEQQKKLEELKKEKKSEAEQDDAKKQPSQKSAEKTKTETVESLSVAVAELKETIEQLKSQAPQPPNYAMGATEGEPADTHVAIGGDPSSEGDLVPRGFLSAIDVSSPPPGKESSGRLELARWIASKDNPLTARVMVNRVWHHLFGRGLVSSVNNFGVLGEPPSHPRLLDYLAIRFMDDGWSTKRLIRSIVLSRVYRLSTRKSELEFAADPDNVLLWRMNPRRLEVEPLRDAILAVSGQLDLSRPDGSTVTPLGQQLARGVSYEKLNPESVHRTVYLPIVRHYAADMLQEFDFAASSLVVGDRAETTTSQQALFFLNHDFVLEQAQVTAELLNESHRGNLDAQIVLAFQRALARRPTHNELRAVRRFLEQTKELLKDEHPDEARAQTMAVATLMQAIFGGAEFRYLIHAPSQLHASANVAATP